MNQINILFIIYDLERGGPEMRLLDFAKYLSNDLKIYICVTSENISLLKEFEKYNVDIRIVPVEKAYLQVSRIKSIYRYIRENQISVINSFDLKGLIIAVFIKLFGNRKLKVVHHTVDILHNYKIRHKAILRLLLKYADMSVCNSIHSKAVLQKRYIREEKIKVINNGIDEAHFTRVKNGDTQVKKDLGIDENAVIIGTVANFRKEKNYPFLINAFRGLLEKYSHLMLLCVGGGEYFDEIKKDVKEHGLDQKVVFTGYSENVVAYMSIMDVFVLCSLQEGFPNVLIQAMSMEIPIVSSSAGGCNEIVNNSEDGLLFEPNNTKEFISSVSRLIEDHAMAAKLARNAKRKVGEKYSLKFMIENYSKFYKKLMLN